METALSRSRPEKVSAVYFRGFPSPAAPSPRQENIVAVFRPRKHFPIFVQIFYRISSDIPHASSNGGRKTLLNSRTRGSSVSDGVFIELRAVSMN